MKDLKSSFTFGDWVFGMIGSAIALGFIYLFIF